MQFFFPLKSVTITQPFGVKNSLYAIGYHMGLDLHAPRDTQVFAAQKGKVVVSKDVGPFDGYGAHIVIDHGNGIFSMYGHLDVIYAGLGAIVDPGQLIAFSGGNPQDYGAPAGSMKLNGEYTRAGASTAPHLHYELDKGAIGASHSIDPAPLTILNQIFTMTPVLPAWKYNVRAFLLSLVGTPNELLQSPDDFLLGDHDFHTAVIIFNSSPLIKPLWEAFPKQQ